jgi:Domain of unknown function (DUF4129)
MGLGRSPLVLLLLFWCSFSIAELEPAQPRTVLTISEYVSELDNLTSSVRQLARPEEVAKLLNQIPPVWRLQSSEQTFDVPSEWLRHDLGLWQKESARKIQDSILDHLQLLRSEAASFENSAPDVSQKRSVLNEILAAREFQNVHGPTWLDRFKQRVLEMLIHMLERVFRSSAVPAIGTSLVYGLTVLAVLAVAYWIYRTIRKNVELETILPHALPVSSKGWKLWMKQARLAADAGNWREAIHMGYWCGISFLEGQELWRPDTARTPREYLRLLPAASEHRQTLGSLTRTFELVWYGEQEADANAFSQTLAQLEKLGCQFN